MLNPAQLMGNAAAAQPSAKSGQAPAGGGGEKPGGASAPTGGASEAAASGQPQARAAGGGMQLGGRESAVPRSFEERVPEELRVSGSRDKDEKDRQSIGHEDFLELMMVQLKNQDPMNPQDPSEMMGQLAQFATASGIHQLQSDFSSFFEHMRSDQSLRAAQLIGREVLTEGDKGYLPEEGELQALLQLEQSAPNLTIEIQNQAGERVYYEQLGEVQEGERPFSWDGTNDDGRRLPSGQYRVRAYVEDGEDRRSVSMLVGAPVTSVSMGQGGRPPQLDVVGLGEMSLADVKRVR
ncbi:hypothetical protein CKO15_05930 [Halorhodospira abdelmalekii]|uniref:flagellar hook assembly protein FlgD n=1 Tax=Halorhodospira abdelmalekii TaxID=421629 RepID=UPI0019050436|nr:FlgD immunoglobulin-like domain containing protein [Halorhodospira abdelmalekii]MBK1734834.1 hypothetical protein [Halorhodospira abdelmalekii]